MKKEKTNLVLLIQCPHCTKKFKTKSVDRGRCPNCERSFTLYPKGKRSRILKMIKGTRTQLLHAHQRFHKPPRIGDKENAIS